MSYLNKSSGDISCLQTSMRVLSPSALSDILKSICRNCIKKWKLCFLPEPAIRFLLWHKTYSSAVSPTSTATPFLSLYSFSPKALQDCSIPCSLAAYPHDRQAPGQPEAAEKSPYLGPHASTIVLSEPFFNIWRKFSLPPWLVPLETMPCIPPTPSGCLAWVPVALTGSPALHDWLSAQRVCCEHGRNVGSQAVRVPEVAP